MAGFNAAWWVALGIGVALLTIDFKLSAQRKKKLGWPLLALSFLFIGIGLSGFIHDYWVSKERLHSQPQLSNPLQAPSNSSAPSSESPKPSKKSLTKKDAVRGNSVHIERVSKIEQQSSGDCSPNMIGGANTVSCGPPPLKLNASLRTVTSDKQGLIETIITVTPNQPVAAPCAVAIEFDNPIASIAAAIAGTATTTLTGRLPRLGKHVMVPVGDSFNPQHALVINVYSEQPIRVVGDPHLE